MEKPRSQSEPCLCEEKGRPGEGRAGTEAPGQEPRAGLQRTAREEGTWGTGTAGRGRHSLTAVRVVALEAMGSGCSPSPWKVRPA